LKMGNDTPTIWESVCVWVCWVCVNIH